MTATSTESLPLFGASLDPQVARYFSPLCLALPEAQIPGLQASVREHVEEVERALGRNEFLDLDTVERVAHTLNSLLAVYDEFPEAHQALVVGAARYFSESDDAEPDTLSLLGFDDDVTVLNYMLEQIGRPELKIDL